MLGLGLPIVRAASLVGLLLVVLNACASSRQRCEANGGRVVVGRSGREACQTRAADAGKPCRGNADCEIMCECSGELGFPGAETRADLEPLEGSEAGGECAAYPAAPGSGWHCLVADGRVVRRGVIVD